MVSREDAELSRRISLLVNYSVMPGLVPGIHVVLNMPIDVDGRDKPGHDDVESEGRKTQILDRDGGEMILLCRSPQIRSRSVDDSRYAAAFRSRPKASASRL